MQLTSEISVKRGVNLDQDIRDLLRREKVICRALNKRPVFLTKYLSCVENRHDKTRRKQKFPPALELIQRADKKDLIERCKGSEFDLHGVTRNGNEVGVHIREELEHGDRKLFLISTF